MRYLLLSSSLLLLIGCSPVYKNLQPANGDIQSLQKLKPSFSVALYNTKVDVLDNHLSGLLLIKRMPDSTTRLVFSNEIGFKFFDFEFSKSGDFKVFSIIPQINRKAVIKTLRKDFELFLMERLNGVPFITRKDDHLLYYTFPKEGGFYHYITTQSSDTLVRMERSSKRKIVVRVTTQNYIKGIPDNIGITHTNFKFTIGLKRIER